MQIRLLKFQLPDCDLHLKEVSLLGSLNTHHHLHDFLLLLLDFLGFLLQGPHFLLVLIHDFLQILDFLQLIVDFDRDVLLEQLFLV